MISPLYRSPPAPLARVAPAGTLNAMYSPEYGPPLTATTMYCLPLTIYVIGDPATDSKGNIYTTETYEGKRLQKFVYKGMGPVSANQGVVWPSK